MTRPVTAGFHHITMVSGDAKRTLDFYSGLLGLPLVKKTVNFDDPSAYHLYFGAEGGRPGTILTFFEWPHAPKGRWGVGGVHHVAISAPDRPALLKWKRRLTDAGVPVTGPIDRGYFTSLYFSDPDGQILEIATEGPGYAIDEPADALGTTLIQPPSERLTGGRDEAAIRAETYPEPVPEVTPDMRLGAVHHVSAITDDLERAGDFYEEALGLRLVKKTFNQDDGRTKHYFWASYDGEVVQPGSSMTLFDWAGASLRAAGGRGQTHHIAFRVPSREEQLAWREHLLSPRAGRHPGSGPELLREHLLPRAGRPSGRSRDGRARLHGRRAGGGARRESAASTVARAEPRRHRALADAAVMIRSGEVAGLAYDLAAASVEEEGGTVAVLLHGRGSHKGDLQGLGPVLPDSWTLVTPQAPHPGGPWGYGPGWAWYRYAGEDRLVPETLDESLTLLDGFLEALPGLVGFEPARIVLGGFSQGGTTSVAYGLTRPGAIHAALNFSGFLADSVELTPEMAASAPPIFWGHGASDAAIPMVLAQRGLARFEAAGIPVHWRQYPIGHWMIPEEIHEAVAMVDAVP